MTIPIIGGGRKHELRNKLLFDPDPERDLPDGLCNGVKQINGQTFLYVGGGRWWPYVDKGVNAERASLGLKPAVVRL